MLRNYRKQNQFVFTDIYQRMLAAHRTIGTHSRAELLRLSVCYHFPFARNYEYNFGIVFVLVQTDTRTTFKGNFHNPVDFIVERTNIRHTVAALEMFVGRARQFLKVNVHNITPFYTLPASTSRTLFGRAKQPL